MNFRATGKLPQSQGWRVVYDGEQDDEDEDDKADDKQTVPAMKKGDPVTAEKGELSPRRTKPPAAFTDGTLVAAMTNVHLFVQDPEIKKRLKENEGIGTEATRAAIIDGLILVRRFLQRSGSGKVKKITSTEAGRSIIDALPPAITSPGLTAIWEAQLSKISKGEADEEGFMKALYDTLHKRVEQAKGTTVVIKGKSIEPLKGDGEPCPKCGKGVMRTRVIGTGEQKGTKLLACDNFRKDDPSSCRHAVWPDRPKADPVPPAAGHGNPCPKCGKGRLVTKKSAKGAIYLSCDNWKGKDAPGNCDYFAFPEEKIEPMPGHGETCKECGKGRMMTKKARSGANEGKLFLSCSAYPECKNSVFPDSFKSSSGGGKPPPGGRAAAGGKPAAGSKTRSATGGRK
jgi:DNA topoisomerase-3